MAGGGSSDFLLTYQWSGAVVVVDRAPPALYRLGQRIAPAESEGRLSTDEGGGDRPLGSVVQLLGEPQRAAFQKKIILLFENEEREKKNE